MKTLTLHIQDDFVPVFMKMIAGFNQEIHIDEPNVNKKSLADDCFGAWQDDRSADEIIADIKNPFTPNLLVGKRF